MKRRNNEQPTDKKPVVANFKLWREIPIDLQGKVRGGAEGTGEETPRAIALSFPVVFRFVKSERRSDFLSLRAIAR